MLLIRTHADLSTLRLVYFVDSQMAANQRRRKERSGRTVNSPCQKVCLQSLRRSCQVLEQQKNFRPFALFHCTCVLCHRTVNVVAHLLHLSPRTDYQNLSFYTTVRTIIPIFMSISVRRRKLVNLLFPLQMQIKTMILRQMFKKADRFGFVLSNLSAKVFLFVFVFLLSF